MASAQANIAQQGAEFATSSPTDLAITGNGFFCVSTSADQAAQMLYTRASAASRRISSGNLRNSAGVFICRAGLANADGTFPDSGPLGPINISNLGGKGQATANMSIAANLSADDAVYSGTVSNTQPA